MSAQSSSNSNSHDEPESKKQRPTKVTWIPVVAAGGRSDYLISKFGGLPWLDKDESWPVCQTECENKLAFFLQLNIEELPQMCKSWFNAQSGLLQMFYCVECENYEEFSGSKLIRHITVTSGKGKAKVVPPSGLRIFDSKKIIQWSKNESDVAGWEEAGIKCELGDSDDDDDGPLSGDKLGGFPCWVQGVEYPNCNKDGCEKEMRLVFQVDSECNIDYIFGDVGCGHITQCPTHKDVFAFRWACG